MRPGHSAYLGYFFSACVHVFMRIACISVQPMLVSVSRVVDGLIIACCSHVGSVGFVEFACFYALHIMLFSENLVVNSACQLAR